MAYQRALPARDLPARDLPVQDLSARGRHGHAPMNAAVKLVLVLLVALTVLVVLFFLRNH